jgi:hypothetical protein
MSRDRRLAYLSFAGLVVLGLAVASLLIRNVAGAGGHRETEQMLAELDQLRAAADSCTVALDREQAEFDGYDLHVQSLLGSAKAYESQDRTVQAHEFGEYMSAVDEYNQAVSEWRQRADVLSANWEACRGLIERHNVLAAYLADLRYRQETDVSGRR